MKCYLCGCQNFQERATEVRDNCKVKVIECEKCGLVTLSDFNHISESHYQEGKMHALENTIEDWKLETEKDDQRRFEIFKSGLIDKSLLDFGCGNGAFLIKTIPYTKISCGVELEERVRNYYSNSEIRIMKSIEELKFDEKFDIITSFHVFEHLQDPVTILNSLSSILKEKGEIIIEVPNSDDALLTLYNNESFSKFTYWSQHLFLFNQHTIVDLVKKANLKLNWVKQIQRYGLANHLYWLSNNKPGGQIKWRFINNNHLDEVYAHQLASIGKCDTIMASISIK